MGTATTSGENGYAFREFFFDLNRHTLLRNGETVALRPRSFRVLQHLLANHGRLVTRDELMQAVWGDTVVTEGSLTQCIIDIRRAIGDDTQTMIRTVPREGYVFEEPVTPRTPTTGAAETAEVHSGWRIRPGWLMAAAIGVVIAGLLAWQYRGDPGSDAGTVSSRKSIAVLPFTDMSPAGDRQYFADGLAEEILALLARSPDLRVIARTSSFSLRDRDDLDVMAIGRLLQARYLLEGSIRHGGESIRVNARLVGTEDGGEIWSAAYDGEPGDTLRFQTEIAQAVGDALEVALQARAPTRVTPEPAGAAYDAYVRGHYFHTRRGEGDLERAKDLYLEAISLQPDYGRPWAGLAGLYLLQLTDRPQEYQALLELLRNAALTAIALDPELAEAHARLSQFYALSGKEDLRQRHLALAAELNPNSPLILGLEAGRLMKAGEYEQAAALKRRAAELDPLGYVNRYNLASMLLLAGEYEEAEAELAQLADLRDDDPALAYRRFEIYLLQGRLEDAAAAIDGLPPGLDETRARALLHSATGESEAAGRAMSELADEGSWEAAVRLSEVHAFRGEPAEALRWLETSRQRLGSLPVGPTLVTWNLSASASPFLKELRDHPAAQEYFAAER